MRRLTLALLLLFLSFALIQPANGQESPASTPVAETVTPEPESTGTPAPDPTETVEPEATPTPTSEAIEPAAASPTATPVSGVVDNGDGSYTLTANPGDTVDLDLSSMLPAGGIVFGQLVSLSATIVSVSGSCSHLSPVFFLNDFGDNPPTQGVTIALGDPGNGFACSTGGTGNLIDGGARFFTYHSDQSGGPSDGSYASMLNWLGATNLPGMKFRLDNASGASTTSITVSDFSIVIAPLATLNVSVQLCQTSDADALAREVDYTLDAFGPAAAPDCTTLDPAGIPITTSLLDSGGAAFATFDAVTQSDGSIDPVPGLGSATSLQFWEGLYGRTSDPLAIPEGGGANIGITIYVSGALGSIALRDVNAFGQGGLGGAVFALYRSTCTGTPIATGTTDDNGDLLFSPVTAGVFCIANVTAPAGFPMLDPITDIAVAPGQAVNLGNFESQPPMAPVTVFLPDNNNNNAHVPHGCVALYQHYDYPVGTPSGLIGAKSCDDDGNGSILLQAPLGVPFTVVILSAPVGFIWYAPPQGEITASDLPNGITLSYLVYSGNNTAVLNVTSQLCEVSDPADVTTTITIEADGATPAAGAGCTALDANFELALYGAGSEYAPITISTTNGAATVTGLPYTGDAIFPGLPATDHAIVDSLRPGASGVSATFEFPEDGVQAVLISVYALPVTPTPTVTVTATVEPSTTPTPASTVVALPNTGSGFGGSDNTWWLLLGIVTSGLAFLTYRMNKRSL